MKIHELLEAGDRPIQRTSGKLGQIIGDAEIAPEVIAKFKQQVSQMSPEDQQKIKDMGGIKQAWADFKKNANFTLEIYKDRGVLTMKHPTIGRIETTVNMNIGNLDNGEVGMSGASVKATNPGHSRTTTTRVGQQDFDRAQTAVGAELSRQGIDPNTGVRR